MLTEDDIASQDGLVSCQCGAHRLDIRVKNVAVPAVAGGQGERHTMTGCTVGGFHFESLETRGALDQQVAISADLVAKNRAMLSEVERSRALLKRIEWSAEDCCPSCNGMEPERPSRPRRGEGHAADCELAALIGKMSA